MRDFSWKYFTLTGDVEVFHALQGSGSNGQVHATTAIEEEVKLRQFPNSRQSAFIG